MAPMEELEWVRVQLLVDLHQEDIDFGQLQLIGLRVEDHYHAWYGKGVGYPECIVLNIYGILFQILALIGSERSQSLCRCLESKNCI